MYPRSLRRRFRPVALLAAACLLWGSARLFAADAPDQPAIVHADVVALDQSYWYNRLGASQPGGMIFALAGDVVVTATGAPIDLTKASSLAGQVSLRPDKRPRPIVLRVNVGQTLEITFVNLLDPTSATDGVGTRSAGFHVAGLELAANPPAVGSIPSINNDATWVGTNGNALVAPGSTTVYRYYAKAEGPFYVYSGAGDWNGQTLAGLFGTVVVEPSGAEWFRSQVTQADLALAASSTLDDGRPLIKNYHVAYPSTHPHAGQPILAMTTQPVKTSAGLRVDLVASDLTAIITGPNAGEFPVDPLNPDFAKNPSYPHRRQPFREFAIMYHEIFAAQQAFPQFNSAQLGNVLGNGTDSFAINYGAAGIGAEVLASRLGVGPMGGKQSVDLKFEEFFLSSWSNGDPAMVVDVPANATVNLPKDAPVPPPVTGTPTTGPVVGGERATKAFYPDDPSNVYHSYTGDHVTMRVLHTGTQVTHVHHLHAHQWLRSPNDANSSYLDSQMIAPGSTFTMEIAFNGSGNLNETVGDSIFHCHFYPHFAGGMWALWRVHDVFEAGTVLDSAGRPLFGPTIWNRALPDAEILAGTPIPAVVPMPTLAMAPAPAPVRLVKVDEGGTRAFVAPRGTQRDGDPVYDNPGYPFFVPGVSGHRAPHPPMDFAWDEAADGKPKQDAQGNKVYLDGGLPRHLVLGGTIVRELHTRWDFTKDFIAYDKSHKPIAGGLLAFELPENGTAVEKAAMVAHSTRKHYSFLPDGQPGIFTLNGQPSAPGAPFANPSVDLNGDPTTAVRRYQAAAIQMDVVLTKQGWHFPQQRMIALWQDVKTTIDGTRAPQPLFFRANSGETIEFWHTNLVPDYYEMDDFQIRTPTDIIGQHIHLVKFDVLASDGAGNGWNYEDGTFSPDEVRGRIDALNLDQGLFAFDPKTQFKGTTQTLLKATDAPTAFGTAPAGQDWTGAQTTIQRWNADPITNNAGEDRTLRTVFTHDHFGPSTHQQVGLYGGLLVEPAGSKWYDPISGGLLADKKTRFDGGPTSWQANIVTPNPADSYREFALEFGDFQLAYTAGSKTQRGTPTFPQFTAAFPGGLQAGAVASSSTTATVLTQNGVNLATTATLSGSDAAGWTLAIVTPTGATTTYAIALVSPGNPTATPPVYPNYKVVPKSLTPLFTAAFTEGLKAGLVSQVAQDAGQVFASNGVVLAPNAQLSGSDASGWTLTSSAAPGVDNNFSLSLVPGSTPSTYQVVPLNLSPGWSASAFAINPPPPDGAVQNTGAPYPGLISGFPPPGTYSLNYRAEPIPARLWNPTGGPNSFGTNTAGPAGDLANAYVSLDSSSPTPRADPLLNVQPAPGSFINPATPQPAGSFTYPADLDPTAHGSSSTDYSKVQPGDPFTPVLRAYAGDKVQIRTLVGAHHNAHFFSVDGVKWLHQPKSPNTGYLNNQPMGISEHYEMLFDLPLTTATTTKPFADYLYNASAGSDGVTNGLWGLMRSYNQKVDGLTALPNNPPAATPAFATLTPPPGAKIRQYHVVATTAQQALGHDVIYNTRTPSITVPGSTTPTQSPIHLPNGLLYVRAEDLTSPDQNGTLLPTAPVEPLILRAAAGEWIEITLTNAFDPASPAFSQASATSALPPFTAPPVPTISLPTSSSVGLNPQVVGYDITAANGVNVGFNPSIAIPAKAKGTTPVSTTFYWYAGTISWENGVLKTTPVELGGINLNPADPLVQQTLGLVGALVIEPEGSTWSEDKSPTTRAAVTVTRADGSKFRDFVMVCQDDVPLLPLVANPNPPPTLTNITTSAVNYRTEPMSYYRFKTAVTKSTNVYQATANSQLATTSNPAGFDPQTPIFTADPGSEVHFHMLHPSSGDGIDGETLTIDGHVFQEEPFANDSRTIGSNPQSQWFGTRGGHGARNRFEVVIKSAGGDQKVPGDYLYRSTLNADIANGIWGIFRVGTPQPPQLIATTLSVTAGNGIGAEISAAEAAPKHAAPEPVASRHYHDGVRLVLPHALPPAPSTEKP